MIILVTKNDNIVRYVFNEDTYVELNSSNIKIGNPLQFVIGDMTIANTNKYTQVSDVPSDFFGCKYKYDGASWSANPEWTPPLTEEELAALHEENKS